MTWTKDSLIAKAKIFFEKAFSEDRENIFFGLLCALGLELLERASIAKISPTLLADQDEYQRNILYALEHKSGNPEPKSITTTRVINLCEKLVNGYDIECKKISLSMANRRNSEAHSGAMAFIEFDSDRWISGFYYVVNILSQHLGITLHEVFNESIVSEAETMLTRIEDDLKAKVCKEIANRKLVYDSDKRNNLPLIQQKISDSNDIIQQLVHEGYHKVKCPSCENYGTIFGNKSVETRKILSDESVEVITHIIPTQFECRVCGLILKSHQELRIAQLPLHYNRKTIYSPEEYYGTMFSLDSESDDEPYYDYSND